MISARVPWPPAAVFGPAFGVNAAGLITAGAVAGRSVTRFDPAIRQASSSTATATS